ncbi:unnamed protein product [Heterobilharzia americana]|nr:unnamed protein product [Heterobilharzia americana]
MMKFNNWGLLTLAFLLTFLFACTNKNIVSCQQSVINYGDYSDQFLQGAGEYGLLTPGLVNIPDKQFNLTLLNVQEPTPISAISLAIVFDSTGSMGNDLKQVKIGSRRILQRHLQRGEANYIKDFVLVKVHDPDWKLVRDASQEQCRSWQTITFPLQLVTFIRVVGTYNTANDVFHLVHLECPYPPAETTESDTEAHGEKLLGLTTSVMPEPNNDRGNIVIPLSSRVNQHDSSNDNVGSDEYQSRNSHQSPVIGEITQDRVLRDSDSIRSESSVHDTNDQSNVFRMHYNQRPNTMTTTIADYDLMSDLNTSSPSTTADGGNIALTASTIAVSSTPATTISDQHGMAPVGQDSLPHYSFHHA